MQQYSYLRKRFRNVGLSQNDSYRAYQVVTKYFESNGIHFATSRLKTLGDCLIWYLYHTGEKPAWVKTRSRFPKELYFLKKYSEEVILRFAKLARSITFPEMTNGQREKILTGVQSPYSGDEDLRDIYGFLTRGVISARLKPNSEDLSESKVPLIGRQFRRIQSLSGQTPTETVPPLLESINLAKQSNPLTRLEWSCAPFAPLDISFVKGESIDHPYIGEIHAAQEGGGKLRMFASPYTYYQCLLYPIHFWLDKFRSQLYTDCTYDQESGAIWAQENLVAGNQVHSVDLSTATCRFPLWVQTFVLRLLGLQQKYVEALEFSCKGKWKVGDELVEAGFPETLSWAVGQPLGIAPSMSMFSLTHNLLLTGICDSLGLVPSDSFRVLGDDVVLINETLHTVYRSCMAKMGVPISEHKSHSSFRYAEFAGFSISKTVMVRPGRWRKAVGNNHLQIALDLGTPLIGESPKPWIAAEKLWLFRMGNYNPTSDKEYLKLLKANTQLGEDWLDLRLSIPYTRWEDGFKMYCMETLGVPYNAFDHFHPRLPRVTDVFSALPDGIWKEVAIHNHRLQMSMDLRPLTSAYTQAVIALSNYVISGDIPVSELPSYVKRVEASVLNNCWVPPATDRVSDTVLTKRLLRAYLA